MKSCPPLALVALMLLAPPALAETADRGKAINIEADKLSVDDKNKIQIFEGRVVMTQGSLQIMADRVQVTQDADGFQKGVATAANGGLARFKQKREGKNEYVEGQAERIVYNGRNDVAELFQRAHIKSGQDEVRGPYIRYDGISEKYEVNKDPSSNAPQTTGRVSATIAPRRNEDEKSPK